jgi:hypothetical protein
MEQAKFQVNNGKNARPQEYCQDHARFGRQGQDFGDALLRARLSLVMSFSVCQRARGTAGSWRA